MDYKYLRSMYIRYLRYFLAKDGATATTYDKFMALCYAVRNELVDRWINTQRNYADRRRVYFLSMEYVFGKSLYKNMVNLGIEEALTSAISSLGVSVEELFGKEEDFDLGNGGKGMVAACMLESMAALGIPAMAYGLRYDYAQFKQEIKNGVQIEHPNDWLHKGHPWEIVRPEYECVVKFAGSCRRVDENKPLGPYKWENAEEVHAIPYDVPVVGYRNETVNTLRLWSARPSEEFLPDYFNHNDYVRACEEKSHSGLLTKVLFPEEDVKRAHDLRIRQQYFFVSAVIQDIVRRHKKNRRDILELDKKIAIQLTGSRCALAIPEMMRILVDQEGVEWPKAWDMTKNIFSYTSSAVRRDHIETWPVYKLEQTLPRIMQVIYDINQQHLDTLREQHGHNTDLVRSLSLIEEGEVKRIRLADMAILGASFVNGVSAAQTELLKKLVFPTYYAQYPDKFINNTSGASHRSWLMCANKPLSTLITRTIGDGWIREPAQLEKLEKFTTDQRLLRELYSVKTKAKAVLCRALKDELGVSVDSNMFFDVQSRTIHTSNRHFLHILHIMHRYLLVKSGVTLSYPRVHIFAGKASPSDFLAKQIIHLINIAANLINSDPVAREQMRVVFIPNFGVNWAERLVCAADLSEQISAATLESSGTFNMKYAFNGSLTIASRSGSNIEMIKKIGEENVFSFGKPADELLGLTNYNPGGVISSDERLRNIFALLDSYLPTLPDGNYIYPLLSSLRDSDRRFVLLDFSDYVKNQQMIDELYQDRVLWGKKSLLNIAGAGWFSSDRTVNEFSTSVWKIL
ncbi:MAG: glycogen/starch/alpha-glucan family phosphorylase [Chitinispirillales bacterium]|jgi:starch phosphorylase|nr:glycogen/starch/alpha-glucan family phosphorylase [Chitinispirillales bacterium]